MIRHGGKPLYVHRGFTLVEALVVMALLSLIVVGMAGALGSLGQIEGRVDSRLAQADDRRVATVLLRSIFGRVSARKVGGVSSAPGGRVAFEGQAEAVSWIGVMPARFGSGGRQYFRLELDHGREGRALILRFSPWAGGEAPVDWARADARVLLQNVASFRMRYQGAANRNAEWTDAWVLQNRLPDRVAISIEAAGQAWPEIVVPLRAMPLSDPEQAGFVIGGSR